MVRWTEQKDSYVLRVSKAEEVAALMALAMVLMGVAVWVFVHDAAPIFHPCCGGPIVGGLGVALVLSYLRRQDSAWIEVPLRGGPVRWSCPSSPSNEPVRVARFQMEVVGEWGIFSRPHHHVVALTEGGEEIRMLGHWESVDAVRVQGIVSQLNQLLVTEG